MSTIFHAGRKILRQEIGNHNYAEIADLLFFRVQGTKYYDEQGKPFFLLPNINYIAEETGFKERSCERALADLDKNEWIDRVKIKCYDGAVRTKIYITDKFKSIMSHIDQLLNVDKKNNVNSKKEYNSTIQDVLTTVTSSQSDNESITLDKANRGENDVADIDIYPNQNQSHNTFSTIEKEEQGIETAITTDCISNAEQDDLTAQQLDSAKMAGSDSANLAESYIKEKTIKEENNNYNKYQEPKYLDNQISQIVIANPSKF